MYNKHFAGLQKPGADGYAGTTAKFTLDNFVVDPNVAILIKLEYVVAVPMGDKIENTSFVVGYAICMPQLDGDRFIPHPFDETVTTGPGVAPTGEMLWDPNFEQENMVHRIAINLSGMIEISEAVAERESLRKTTHEVSARDASADPEIKAQLE